MSAVLYMNTEMTTLPRTRFALRAAALVVALLSVGTCVSCTLGKKKVRNAYQEAYDPSAGRWAALSDDLFGKKMVRTGLLKPQRFLDVVGFGIFLTAPHDPDRVPVLFLHGHAGGPRLMTHLAGSLDPQRFEPWYGYYPTGLDVDELGRLLRRRLSAVADAHDVSTVHIVAHSMGGLVARAGLGGASMKDDDLPRIPHVICLGTPWGGDPRPARWTWSPLAPPSWDDMSPDAPFIAHLFDDPLPGDTQLHVIYGLASASGDAPGETDGVVTVQSLTRAEALDEATTVDVFAESNHVGLLTDPDPVFRVNDLLH